MIRPHVLIAAAVLCLPGPTGAQATEWKPLACTFENPPQARGQILTFEFSESGKVRFEGEVRNASVDRATIAFGVPPHDLYKVSRISGRFTAIMGGGEYAGNGTCIPEGVKPKF